VSDLLDTNALIFYIWRNAVYGSELAGVVDEAVANSALQAFARNRTVSHAEWNQFDARAIGDKGIKARLTLIALGRAFHLCAVDESKHAVANEIKGIAVHAFVTGDRNLVAEFRASFKIWITGGLGRVK
jgi:hypothetical protein